MRRTILLCAIATLGAAPSAALAQQPAPQPVQTQMQLTVEDVGGALATTLVGSKIRVRATLGAFVAGEQVAVRFYDGDKQLALRTQAIQPGPNGTVASSSPTARSAPAVSWRAPRTKPLPRSARWRRAAALST